MFGGFDTSAAKSVRVTSRTMEGEGRSTVVVACTVEVEGADGDLAEVEYEFAEGQTMTVATFEAFLGALNQVLS